MKKINFLVIFILVMILFGCGPSASERAKYQGDTLVPTTISYDTTVLHSKKVTRVQRPSAIILENYNLDSTTSVSQVIGDDHPRRITREKRVLKVVPNIETTSKNISGRLNYVMSDTMEVGQSSVVEVSISRNMTKTEVINKVSTFRRFNNNVSEVVDTIIRVTPVMVVKLQEVGTVGNFHIDTITPMRQVVEVEDTTLTVWQWKVTPLKDGNKTLTLTVDLVIDGVEKNLTIYDGHIYVHMKNKMWVLIGNHFSKYWQWWCTAALFPILVWLFKTYILPRFRKT